MAKRGRKITFHGAYSSKKDAVRKERKVGGYVQRIRVQGQVRYAVITRND